MEVLAMGYFRRLAVAAVGALSLLGAASVTAGADGGNTLIEFHTMTPVTGTAVGAVNDRGIPGGGLPWAITSGKGEVDTQGNLEVKVTGLIIPVLSPPRNPLPTFSAAVSCLNSAGVPTNVVTGPVPTGLSGDATFETEVALPKPCLSPEVFVGFTRNGTFIWFAESNAEADD
jgi:hypothetical protein